MTKDLEEQEEEQEEEKENKKKHTDESNKLLQFALSGPSVQQQVKSLPALVKMILTKK